MSWMSSRSSTLRFATVSRPHDRPCPIERTDVDCTGYTDILDVVTMIDVIFRHADPEALFCNPCDQA